MQRLVVILLSLFLFLTPARAKDGVLKSPNSEVSDALKFILEKPDAERTYIRFFSTYAIPTNIKVRLHLNGEEEATTLTLREAAPLVLSFWVNSLSSQGLAAIPQPVTDTLFWIDIRDYGWTEQAWEKVSVQDPYFREPWISHDHASVLRFEAGNAIMRADWFIVHASDVTKQVDRDIKVFPYYELLYSNPNSPLKGKIPADTAEFQKFWGFDVKMIEELMLARGTIIKKGESAVSRHNRQIWRGRVPTGYYWLTQDVKNMVGDRDYQENIEPGIRKSNFDAEEHIGTNKFGLQVYLLANAQLKRVEFADNAIVTDNSDNPNGGDTPDRRVRTARSCVLCHPSGINECSNMLRDTLKHGIDLMYHNKEDFIKATSFYLDKNFNQYVKDDQEFYKRAIAAVNGLDSAENSSLYGDLIRWYEQDVTLEQAALEVGVKVQDFQDRCKDTIRGGLGDLVTKNVIARETWDEPNIGVFTESMLRVYGLSMPPKAVLVKPVVKPAVKTPERKKEYKMPIKAVTKRNANVIGRDGKTPVGVANEGSKFLVTKIVDGWALVNYNNTEAWVLTKDLRRETSEVNE